MNSQRHGLSIGIERIGRKFFLSLKAVGKLTHADYEKINPMIDNALKGISDPDVKVLFDASQLEGWELRAAWDDFRLGLRHGNDFSKIALYGTKKWQEWATKVGSWFISGEARYFENLDEAIDWLDLPGETAKKASGS